MCVRVCRNLSNLGALCCREYQWPQRVRAGRISEQALAERFPVVAEEIENATERRYAYAAELGESAAECLAIVDGATVGGVVLKALEVRL